LFDLHVEPEWRRHGCASHLLNEAFRLLRRRGVATIEAQCMATNEQALCFYQGLGFIEVDRGYVFRKGTKMQNGSARPALSKVASWL
jgi:ribosomal protein S18 acetylase RimI-like enzyme